MPDDDMTPEEQAIASSVAWILDQLPTWVREECETLAALNPADAGLSMGEATEDGLIPLIWVGRTLGWIRLADEPGPPPSVEFGASAVWQIPDSQGEGVE